MSEAIETKIEEVMKQKEALLYFGRIPYRKAFIKQPDQPRDL